MRVPPNSGVPVSLKVKFVVCSGKHCRKSGSKDVACAIEKYCDLFGLDDAKVKKKDCLGFCGRGPAMKVVKKQETILGRVDAADCKQIVRAVKDRKKKQLQRYLVK